MSILKQRYRIALLLCVAVAGCSANRPYDSNSASNMGSNANSGSSMGSGTGGSSVGAASGVSDAGNAATAGSTGVGAGSTMASNNSNTSSSSYGTVQAIDPGTRQDIGVGTLGAAAAGGSMGSPSDKVYRVTVRMDDGSTQSVVVDAMPSSYKAGDRVRYSNGSLQRASQ